MPDVATRSIPSVRTTPWMRALPPAARLILHGGAAGRAAAAPIWGVGFAEQACRAIVHGARATLWLGPDEYLLLGPPDEPTARAAGELERALSGIPHALIDISHRQVAIEISGPHAITILSGGCPLDLDPSAFPVGMCTRTVLAKADIVLWRTGDDVFHLEIWRSFCDYVTELLSEIAAEFDAAK
jgi:sarcosine oxidase subunit gamma